MGNCKTAADEKAFFIADFPQDLWEFVLTTIVVLIKSTIPSRGKIGKITQSQELLQLHNYIETE